jgi:membrane-bound inhibitor of C-type lysozyme
MKKIYIYAAIVFLLSTSVPIAGKCYTSIEPDTISLLEASSSDLLVVRLTGAYNPRRPQAAVSSHIGECINIGLRNKSKIALNIVLPTGTILLSKDSSAQNMLVTQTQYYALEPGQQVMGRLYALCAELKKNAPDVYVGYNVGPVTDNSNLLRLAQVIESTGAQNKAGQYAVWAITDLATQKDLGEDFVTLAQSQELLDKAGVSIDIFGKVKADNNSKVKSRASETVARSDAKNEPSEEVIEDYLLAYSDIINPSMPSDNEKPSESDNKEGINDQNDTDQITPTEEEDNFVLILAAAIVLSGTVYLLRKKHRESSQA